MVNLLKQVALQRKRILRDLLLDSCSVYPTEGELSVDSGGVATFGPSEAREWVHPFTPNAEPTTAIPCLLTPNKSQQPDKLKNQIVIVDQYYIELPHNFKLEPTDIVFVTDSFSTVHRYRVSKLDLQGNLSLTNVALIQELSVALDRTP